MLLRAIVLFVFALACGACSRKNQEAPQYIKKAYLEQKSQKQRPPQSPALNEAVSDEVVVDLDERYPSQTARGPNESLAQWRARTQEQLYLNADEVDALESEYEALIARQLFLNGQVNALLRDNQEVRDRLSKPILTNSAGEMSADATKPLPVPFTVHLVKKGDTLFSIANRYYHNGAAMKDIFVWNQGWIRNEDELMAGVGIVLFLEGTKEKSEQLVENYLKELKTQ